MSKAKKKAIPVSASITDVSHPGTSAPSDTSKPIINRRPMIKDPMVVEDNDGPDTEGGALPAKKSSKAKLMPLSEQPEDGDGAPAPADTTDGPAPDDKAEPDTDEPQEPKESKKPRGSAESGEAESADDTTDDTPDDASDDASADAPKPKAEARDEAAAKAEADAEARLQKLVESKKYFLPLNAVEHRRSARFTAVGIILALILAVAWVDVALDAGLIHLGGVKPVTHLFSN